MKQLRVDSIEAWRSWLRKNHEREDLVWLVFRKKGKGPVPFDYQQALDEALCMGWVDSLMKRIDDDYYMRKFTPRKATSTWSDRNKERVELLILQGKMMPAGMKSIEVARGNGMWDKGVQPPALDDSLPDALLSSFRESSSARDHYFGMPERAQKQFNIWINMAKRAETVQRRVNESIRLLENGEKLGLK
jgi:uncharacterized protein YdeI (YjbR/CyaY-like superfamily)